MIGDKASHIATVSKPIKYFNVNSIRKDFPILAQKLFCHPLVYLDNAATAQTPESVITASNQFNQEYRANVHRGVYTLSEQATARFEAVRDQLQKFINAKERAEIIFTKGTTESINLIAQTYGRKNIGPGDEMLITAMEHHSNIVPWQMLCEEKGAHLKVVPINDAGELDLSQLKNLLNPKVKLLSLTHLSNVLGSINPIAEIIRHAHLQNIPVLIDGAQAVPHLQVDVQALNCDFYLFSAHKLYAPHGLGVLYGKRQYLDAMPPYQGGGDMIRSVSFAKTTYNDLPYKFEAGTPNISAVIGLGEALKYIQAIGLTQIKAYEDELHDYARIQLVKIKHLRFIGNAQDKAAVISFVIDGVHPHDIGTVLDRQGISIRAGHHCAQPLMQRMGVAATARVSIAFYNTRDEIDALVVGLNQAIEVFS